MRRCVKVLTFLPQTERLDIDGTVVFAADAVEVIDAPSTTMTNANATKTNMMTSSHARRVLDVDDGTVVFAADAVEVIDGHNALPTMTTAAKATKTNAVTRGHAAAVGQVV